MVGVAHYQGSSPLAKDYSVSADLNPIANCSFAPIGMDCQSYYKSISPIGLELHSPIGLLDL